MRSNSSSRDLLCLHLGTIIQQNYFLCEIFDFLMLIQQNSVISSLWLKISQIADNPQIFFFEVCLRHVKFFKAEFKNCFMVGYAVI